MKSLSLTTGLLVGFILLLPKAAFAGLLPENAPQARTSSLDTNAPFCYMQTADGATLDLTKICGDRLDRSRGQEITSSGQNNSVNRSNTAQATNPVSSPSIDSGNNTIVY